MSFNVYRSSAGSGKTFTLVKEYLKIILADPGDFRHILAITFTNKAANEMKERVLKALKELSLAEQSAGSAGGGPLLPVLMQETGMSVSEIAQTSWRVLELILHNYADFAIGTIDSFSHKLIRTFAHDFGLPVNFNVELESKDLLATAVDLLLDRVGDDHELTNHLVKFLELRLDEDRGWRIDDILAGFAKILLDDEGQTNINKLKHISLEQFHAISGALHARIREFELRIREIAGPAWTEIRQRDIPVGAFYQGGSGIGKYFENLAAGKTDKLEPNSYVIKTVGEDKWHSGKVTSSERADIDAIKPGLLNIYEQLQSELAKHKADYYLRKLMAKTIYPLSVLNEIEKVLNDFKRQNNLVHIAEFNARIAGIVMNEPVPFIYERLGEKYHHILIDEFQDTSVLQWMNFVPLIENALSGGYFNLVVGDGKQAIYRWRGGDVEQFNALPAIPGSEQNPLILQRERSLSRYYNQVELKQNYRSKTEIVSFNNRFFRVIADNVLSTGKDRIFEGLEQLSDPGKTGGYIGLEFLGNNEDGEDLNYNDLTLQRILKITGDATQDGYRLRDMAILCRSNAHASAIARFLLEQGVSVVSSESLLIANSPKVRFIIAFLRFLFEPRNDIVIAEIRMYLDQNGARDEGRWLSGRDDLTILPVYDLCEELIRRYGLNTKPDIYLQFFLDAVLKFSVKISTGAAEFLNWWEKKRGDLSVVVPEGIDAIRVMTIHKAKGLQFPLVILPFAHEKRKITREYLWVDLDKHVAPGIDLTLLRSEQGMEKTVYAHLYRDEQEKSMLDLLNVLYVAMTRPEEQLYILTRVPPKKKMDPDSWPSFFELFLKNDGIWIEDQSVYEFGEKIAHTSRAVIDEISAIRLENVISSDWRNKIEIRLRAPQMWDIDLPVNKSQWGTRIHTLLSWVITGNDIPGALGKGILSGLIEQNDLTGVERLLWSVIRNPLLESFFGPDVKVKTEPEILIPEGSFYRPDRVVFDGNRVTILDYKSGKPRDSHADQIRTYAGYISGMGYSEVNCMLVYLEPEVQVVKV